MIPPELDAWLHTAHNDAPPGWADEPPLEDLRCHPDLVERLAVQVRPKRPRRVFVAGCPVIHHPNGPPYAAAYGTHSLLIREGDAWVETDPWPADIAFSRGTDELRRALDRAFDAVA